MSRQAKNLIRKNIKRAEWKFRGLMYFLDDYYESLTEVRRELNAYKDLCSELQNKILELECANSEEMKND